MSTALFIMSAARELTLKEGKTQPTGFWAEEFVVPYDLFDAAGFDITVASPEGKTPVVDEVSLGLAGGLPPKTNGFRKRLDALRDVLENTISLKDAAATHEEYDVVFYPGGHAPMEDLVTDEDSATILSERLANNQILGLVCHAPAAILATVDSDGRTPFAGKNITALSNVEEMLNPNVRNTKWLLEDRLVEAGLKFHKAALPYRPYTKVDGALFTGQNPQSSAQLADELIRAVC
ncbi:type 1 glutamine amidotransferase domain-containing protein [Corynebacterium sp. 320]|uniref:type 1 glutamine amidotransferase domain-containing protein n=1 Tax=Corynebacterium TaxID=1716 RepID=UPI00125CAED7|nr:MULTISPECIES: type 1 glutamine amidotransferase domain-containing protein [Corynebacterium]KAB1503859.1 type 1 glutamine amidotransferase domain-containing protein [Corynebacterium sp. 320]KAB3527995.1 type 1 glutamine amidotransferase domain-containing protein [Corynebacterium sp. 250]QNP91536.1 type 1 glutamine amidotransferase domain-containing protein [Corynebacterium zhongnanshanii]